MKNRNMFKTLKGFRDFAPDEKRKRDFVVEKIKSVFETFGFEPIETPTLEYASTLLGKYGDEADQLVYTFEDRGKRKVGLRYDQTVPTARFLSQNKEKVSKYFRRYQIQNVFRADNTQKGRYREFLHCDCDIFESTSALADAEILAVFYKVYENLGFKNIKLLVNDRELLFNVLNPFSTQKVPTLSIIQSIDKLSKIKTEGVETELIKKGISVENARAIVNSIQASKKTEKLVEIFKYATALGIPDNVLVFEPTLARGLDYYTGMIFEGVIDGYNSGSVGGGGRYDNLINQLGGPKIPAVGFAIGFDRTIEALENLSLLPKFSSTAKVLITVFGEELSNFSINAAKTLRKANIPTELYPTINDKLGKQIKYANDKNIPFVIIVGPDEAKQDKVTLKNMKSGEEKTLSIPEMLKLVETN